MTSKGSGVHFWHGGRMRNTFSPYFITPNPQNVYSPSVVAFPNIILVLRNEQCGKTKSKLDLGVKTPGFIVHTQTYDFEQISKPL